MDNFTLTFLVKELRQELGNNFLEKVQLVSHARLVFKFRRGRLLISADDQHPTLYLTHHPPERAARSSSPFVLLAQKHLSGGRLDELEQVDYDRILRFRFTTRDESGTPRSSTLVAELIDRRANLYLLDAEDSIIERLIVRQPERQSVGERYVCPEQVGQFELWALTESQFEQLTVNAPSLRQALVQNIKGLSPLMAQEVAWRAREGNAYAAFQSVVQDLRAAQPQPYIYSPVPLDQLRAGEINWEKALILSPIHLRWPLEEAGLVATQFANMLQAVETYEQLVESIRTFQAQKRALATVLRQHRTKLQKRRGRLEADMEQLGDFEQDRRYGELLLANLQQARRGAEGFEVTDYFDPDQRRIEIPTEPHLTPQQAANAYFDRYHKRKRKLEAIRPQLADLETEWARLDEFSKRLEAAGTSDELAPLAETIQGQRLTPGGPAAAKTEKIPGVYRFQSSEHHEILVGRSAEANQTLTFKLARPHDIWLHAADYPGSHVVLRRAKGEPIPFPSLVEAAELAAFFSQARQSGKVVVNYTERKYVHKIRGAAPGLVRLADFKSITVEPRVRATRQDV